MSDFFVDSAYFGIVLSILAYGTGFILNKKTGKSFLNPLLISIILTIIILALGHIDYDVYYSGAKYLNWLLTPATVCLAIPLYEKFEILKSNFKAIIVGVLSGVISSLLFVLIISVLFGLSHMEYVTFLPKSITTAMGIGVSEELGGNVNLTAAVIILTGILGNVFAPFICKLFRITEPIAKGIAIGTSSHVLGTSKAMEMGETEGAMSSLSVAVAGLMTVAGASVFAQIY